MNKMKYLYKGKDIEEIKTPWGKLKLVRIMSYDDSPEVELRYEITCYKNGVRFNVDVPKKFLEVVKNE